MTRFYRICAVALASVGGSLGAPFSLLDWQLWAIGMPFNLAAFIAIELGERHAQSRSFQRVT